MRKLLFTLTFLISSFLIAQPYSISYNINLKYACEDGSSIFIQEGSMNEGESITFPQFTIPDEFTNAAQYQFILDLFEGAIIEIPEGLLQENVKFNITINPFPCNINDIDLKQLFGITFIVEGSNTGAHLPLDYYYFNKGKKAVVKIKSENLLNFLTERGLTLEKIIAWFIDNNLANDFDGITLVWGFGAEYAEIQLEHFSNVVIGYKNSVTDIAVNDLTPTEYNLAQNYPNPFNPSTTIKYSLPENGFTTLKIYNTIGKEIATLVESNKEAGNYSVEFIANNIPSGIYFYTLKSGSFTNTKKMIILK